jgi:alkylhydroperoxidase/carboxymuconolactone decarboxylase family protein YurZ
MDKVVLLVELAKEFAELDWCRKGHIGQAAKAGPSQQEVLEAVEVGMEMGGGPATVSARFALEVMESVCPKKAEA